MTGESALAAGDGPEIGRASRNSSVASRPREDAAQFSDACDYLFGRLQDPMLKTIALRKLHGYTNDEIGRELGVTPRTIDRKLRLIRALWEEEVAV